VSTVSTNVKRGLRDWLNSPELKEQVAKALPQHLSADRMMRVAMTALTRTPKLAECDQQSFFKCLLDLSQWGLEPDGRRAHLIPFENRKRGCVECQLILDYKGLVELAYRTGTVSMIHADVVCENDTFEHDLGQVTKHTYSLREPRGKPYAAYARIVFKDGATKCEIMSYEDIEAIRKRSRAGNSGPWMTDWPEMAKKTVFRRASKWIPLSAEIRDAFERDDEQYEQPAKEPANLAALEAILYVPEAEAKTEAP